MININKYWIVIESLNFPVAGDTNRINTSAEQRIKDNLKVLQNSINLTPQDIVKSIIKDECLNNLESKQYKIIGDIDDKFQYYLYSVKMLIDICKNANFLSTKKEDLVSEKHKTLIISCMVDIAEFSLLDNLHASFYKQGSIFKKNTNIESNFYRLEFILETFSPLLHIRTLRVGKSLDDVQLWYMASIFSLLIAFDEKEYSLTQSDIGNMQAKLQKLWLEFPQKLYYRNLMLLYSSSGNNKQRIHREMLLRLWYPGGFVALLLAVTESQRSEEQSVDEIVANLVAQPYFSIKAQHSLIKQILQFLKDSLKNKDYSLLMGPGLLSIRKLYDNKEENKEFIRNWLEKEFETLIKVESSQLIAMEWSSFVDLVSLLFHIFCISTIATLPSDLLVPYLAVLLELYGQVECYTNQAVSSHLQALILKILNNRSKEELRQIIEYVALTSYPKNWFQLSSNIHIKENPLNMQELRLTLVGGESMPFSTCNKYHLTYLVNILKNSSYNLLVYQHFLMLLQLVPDLIIDTNSAKNSNANIDLLKTEEDLNNKILMDFSLMYEDKIEIVNALESLVQNQTLKAIISDNISDLLQVLQDILLAYAKTLRRDICQTEINSTVLMILLILIREIIENCSINAEDLQSKLFKPLQHIKTETQNENLKYQIDCLLNTIQGNKSVSNQNCESSKNEFEEARSLIESNKSYLQVEGIEKMIKLLNRRDVFTTTNGHILAALALHTLKSPESYTFLNCVRLFVALVYVNERQVLDLLSDEYLNEAAEMDYRLVIGEALLKTSRELGPLCYKYKNIMLNTYMAGCRSPLDEFRFSAFSNLSQMCRQLTYQVHNYFEELLSLIERELICGKYLPAKRAAVMILSDLLAGMDNLLDYEQMLLPIYRLLKYLVASEKCDEKIRIHASNGLKTLSEKCKKLIEQCQQSLPLEKEIKILNIHERQKNLKSHILEMN